jgi:hypothetical protein
VLEPLPVGHLRHAMELRSSKFDPRRQPRRPTARRAAALRGKIVAGLLFATAVIFLATVIGGVFN